MADPQVVLTPVEFNPFAKGERGLVGKAALTPDELTADEALSRTPESKDELLREIGRKGLAPGARAILQQEYQRAFGDEPPATPGMMNVSAEVPANRGAAIAGELRQRKPKSTPQPVFPLEGEKPQVTLTPVDHDPFAAPKLERVEFMKGIIGGSIGSNPKMYGSAIQGLGVMAHSDWLKQQGSALAKLGDENLKDYTPAVGSIANVRTDSVGNALGDFFVKYLPYQAGNALASMAPTIASGLLGVAAGTAIAGPPGAVAGGFGGIVLSGYPMNYGDIYSDALDDKGIQRAIKDGKLTDVGLASITALAAVPITALDSWSMGRFGAALTGPVKKALYQRIFQEMAAGSIREGSTEGLQQIMSEAVQHALGSDKTMAQAAIAVADNAIGGMAGGGLTGGAAGAVRRAPAQPAQTPPTTAETAVQPAPAPAGPAAPPLALGFQAGSPMVVFPDGTTMTRAEAEQAKADGMIHAIPELTPIDQARADAQILKSGGDLDADETRLKNATLVAAYGENAAVRHVIEGGSQFSAIGDAMLMAAPTVERVRGTIKQGQESRDITTDIVTAIDELAKLKESGQSLAQVMAHGVGHDISFEGQQLMQFLDENAGDSKRIANFLEAYLQEVENASGVPSQVRGRAFDIIDEQQRARKEAAATKQQEDKDAAFKKSERELKERKIAETHKDLDFRAKEREEREMALAKASGSGVQPGHKTAMELAMERAKEKRNAKASGAVQSGKSGGPEKGTGDGQGPATSPPGPVPGAAQVDHEKHTRSVRTRGDRQGAEKGLAQVNRGEKIVEETAGWRAGREVWKAVDQAAHEAATSPQNELPTPTPAQAEAGNYQKGHANVGGLDVSIENPAGSKRRPEWPTLEAHYGYVKGVPARSPDKEHVDVFAKPGTAEAHNGPVFVIDQNKADGKFDEPKVMIGYANEKEARKAYLKNYQAGWESRIRAVTEMTMGQFKAKLQDAKGFLTPQPVAAQPASPSVSSSFTAPAEAAPIANKIIAERKTKEALGQIMVKTHAIEAETGRRVTITEKADVALKDVNHQIATMEALLECLG